MNRLIVLLFGAVTFVANAQVPDYVPTEGLVGWWPFNANATDESGNGNDGESQGAVLTSDRNGAPETAYSFDGSSLISGMCESNMDMSIGQALSITYWIRPESFPVDEGVGLFHVGAAGVNYFDYAFFLGYSNEDPEAGYPYFLAGPSLFEENGGNIAWQKLPLFEWSPVTLTVCDGNIRMYMNCELIFENTSGDSFQVMANEAEFVIGSDGNNDAANEFFTGDLDDIGVWNRCLSPCEICGIHNSMLASTMVDAGPDVTVCQGDSVTLNATSALGAYTWSNGIEDGVAFVPDSSSYFTVEGSFGLCNSTDTVFVEVLQPTSGIDTQVVCDSLTWLDGITYTASTNEPFIALTNAAGCDSLVTLDLTVNYTTYNTIDTTVVNVLEYNGEQYTEGGEFLVYLENEAGCDSIVTIKLTVEYVGVDDLETPSAWSVYPNPIESQLTISSASALESYKVQIFNALGQVIWSERVNTQVTIEVDGWPRGMYVVEIQGEGVETRERIQIVLK